MFQPGWGRYGSVVLFETTGRSPVVSDIWNTLRGKHGNAKISIFNRECIFKRSIFHCQSCWLILEGNESSPLKYPKNSLRFIQGVFPV